MHPYVTSETIPPAPADAAEQARFVRERLPAEGLFADHDWRTSPAPYPLGPALGKEIESLGRVLLQFYRAVNLLYRKSVEGKQPEWIARWLDLGKPADLVALQRSPALKNDVPRVIRPDLLVTEQGLSVTELDSVPGGIGLTGWLNQTYSAMGAEVLGGADGMLRGFASIFGDAAAAHIVVSEEASTYRPEMIWLANQLGSSRFKVRNSDFSAFTDGDAVYRFFELFDLANVPNAKAIFELAVAKRIRLTPPPKPMFEEKMLFALLWNRNLHGFWRQELGESFFSRLLRLVPYTWIVDPAPLPPHAAIPELNLTDWRQLKALSQKDRELILKVSGFSADAWGARRLSRQRPPASRLGGSGGRGPRELRALPECAATLPPAGAGRGPVVRLRSQPTSADEGTRAALPILLCCRRGGRGARRTGRRAGDDLPGGQEDHTRHEGCRLRALFAMSLTFFIIVLARRKS